MESYSQEWQCVSGTVQLFLKLPWELFGKICVDYIRRGSAAFCVFCILVLKWFAEGIVFCVRL